MKKILLLLMFIPLVSLGQSYVSPIGFVNNDNNKNKVIKYIEYEVKKTYSAIGMDIASTLRMMERENLNAFKELLKSKNKSILRKVEKTYCDIGMCNYTTILMMYKEESKAANQSLEW
jgi:predicted site-specific integrase-resolvase